MSGSLLFEGGRRFDIAAARVYTHSSPGGRTGGTMALPSFLISEIPEDGLRLSCEVGAEDLTLATEDARVAGLLTLELEVEPVDQGYHVTGALAGPFVRQCVRCLKDFEDEVVLPFAVQFERKAEPSKRGGRGAGAPVPKAPAGEGEAPEEVADAEAEDVYEFSGERVELAGMLREQIILATPMQPLCAEGCLGLCPVCGQDLNERRCGCPEARGDNPFAVLRELRDKLSRH